MSTKTAELYRQQGLLPLVDLFELLQCKLICKVNNNMLKFNSNVLRANEIQHYNMRFCNLYLPNIKLSFTLREPDVRQYNAIPK